MPCHTQETVYWHGFRFNRLGEGEVGCLAPGFILEGGVGCLASPLRLLVAWLGRVQFHVCLQGPKLWKHGPSQGHLVAVNPPAKKFNFWGGLVENPLIS